MRIQDLFSIELPVIQAPMAGSQGSALAIAVAEAGGLGSLPCALLGAEALRKELTTSQVHRAALKSEAARHTALTNVFSGRPARGIVNRLLRELGPMNPAAPAFPLAGAAVASLRARAESQGSGDFSPLWAGQNTSGCREVSAAWRTRELTSIL